MNIMPYLIRGLATGGQFALVAIGYTMVYGILKLINFAHGDLFMVSGMLLIYLMADFPTMPPLVAIIIMIVLTVLIGHLCTFSAKVEGTDRSSLRIMKRWRDARLLRVKEERNELQER